jgi:progressive ankylosis protein
MKTTITIDKRWSLSRYVQLWRQFYPLAMSDFTMALGDTLRTITIGWFPGPEIAFAIIGVVKSIAVCLESPIIPILHASTALRAYPSAHRVLGRFTLIVSLLLTMLLLGLCYEPISIWLFLHIFGLTHDVATMAQMALLLMVPWPAAIACRRYFQGILIRNRQEAALSWAAMVRLMVTALILLLGLVAQFDAVFVGILSLIGAVIVEAVMVVYSAMTIKPKRQAADVSPPNKDVETMMGMTRYYAPLGLTSVVVWVGKAALIAVIAHGPDGMLAVAVWTAALGFFLPIANATRMLQQMVISAPAHDLPGSLLIFSCLVGLIACLPLVFLGFFPMGISLIKMLAGGSSLGLQLVPSLKILFLLPLLVALQNYYQGRLVVANANWCINRAACLNIIAMLLISLIMVFFKYEGSVAAAVATILSMMIEVGVLIYGASFVVKKDYV